MQSEDPQNAWRDYYARKRSQRLYEATAILERMKDAGVEDGTPLNVDFVHFGPSKDNIDSLMTQLSENYDVEILKHDSGEYWIVEGTTRPYELSLPAEQLLNWVEFMADVSQSYACVFSTWLIHVPTLDLTFRSEEVASDS